MKLRIFPLLFAAALLLFTLTACGSEPSAPPAANEVPPSEQSDAATAAGAETPAPGAENTPSSEPQEETPVGDEIPADPAPTDPTADLDAESVQPLPDAEETADGEETPTAAQSTARSLLNAAPLSPMKTNDAALDATVDYILASITTDGMDTYEKVKACYDYLIDHTTYQTKTEATVIHSGVYESPEDYKNVILTTEVLDTGKGVCDHYAAALHVLTRRIGLESYICTGQHASQKGGMGGHVWTVITLGGTDYIFDTQIDDTTKGGYSRFCKTFEEMGSRYQGYNVSRNKADFASFRPADSAEQSGGTTLLDSYFAGDALMTANLEESVAYSKAVADAATLLRADAGMGKMRTDAGAAKVACFAAASKDTGFPLSTEEAANFMVEQGVSFRHVVLLSMGSYVEPQALVTSEQSAFTNPNFDGFAAGVYDGAWVALFYGG